MNKSVIKLFSIILFCPLFSWGKACIGSSPTNCSAASFTYNLKDNRNLDIKYKDEAGEFWFPLTVIQFRTHEEAKLFRETMNSAKTSYLLHARDCDQSGECTSNVDDDFMITVQHDGNRKLSRNELLQELEQSRACIDLGNYKIECNGIIYQRIDK
jgi:hypothetical protein